MTTSAAHRTVCILAAGIGSRQHFAGGRLHKGLIPLGNQGVISRIIARVGPSSRFVIAVGHEAEQVCEYVRLAHPDLNVTFVPVDQYTGPDSGPGTSVLACRDHLSGSFLLTAVDTLVTRVPPTLPGRSWAGVSTVGAPWRYLTLDHSAGRVTAFHERTGDAPDAFVGLAWIADAGTFFDGLESGSPGSEFQVTSGLAAVAASSEGLWIEEVDWLDTGTDEGFARARTTFSEEPGAGRQAVDVTYLFDDRVVKWFASTEQAARCRDRASALGSAVPAMITASGPWLAYERAPGATLRDRVDPQMVDAVIDWASATLWLQTPGAPGIHAAARDLYGAKTMARLDQYLAARGESTEVPGLVCVNGSQVPPVSDMITDAVALTTSNIQAAGFHGDFHEGNIIEHEGHLITIDWRSDFGGLHAAGDPRYDLAKFLHTLELPESVMSAGRFLVADDGGVMRVANEDSPLRESARAAFWRRCDKGGFDWRQIAVLDALVFVSMAPLYDTRLGEYLYWLGRWLLAVSLQEVGWHEREEHFRRGCLSLSPES